jgi:hypothetical protein
VGAVGHLLLLGKTYPAWERYTFGRAILVRDQAKIMPEVKLGQFHPDAVQGADATGGGFLKMKGILSR